MASQYKIVFRGDIAPGFTMMDVRAGLQEMFRLDDETVAKLFAGRPVAIKKNLDEPTARKWCDLLLKAGAIAECVADQAEEATHSESTQKSYGMEISPVGADVLTPSERTPHASADIPTEHLSLDDVGADVLRESERKPFAERELDLSHLQLKNTTPE